PPAHPPSDWTTSGTAGTMNRLADELPDSVPLVRTIARFFLEVRGSDRAIARSPAEVGRVLTASFSIRFVAALETFPAPLRAVPVFAKASGVQFRETSRACELPLIPFRG